VSEICRRHTVYIPPIFSYAYVDLLVLISDRTAQRTVMDHLKPMNIDTSIMNIALWAIREYSEQQFI
jgi:hypothetical protein